MSKRRNRREPSPEPERRRYEIGFTRTAERGLAALPKAVLVRVDAPILRLALDPRPAGSKKLKGSEELYRIRVGDYRVVYQIDYEHLRILVVNVGNRRDVYRDL